MSRALHEACGLLFSGINLKSLPENKYSFLNQCLDFNPSS